MLVLTRRPREQIVVPDCNLTFTVLEVRGNKVIIGVSAPPDVAIHRYEVWARLPSSPEQPASNPTV